MNHDDTKMSELNIKPASTNIVQIYAPTSTSPADEVDVFFEELQKVKDKISKRETCFIMGNFNVQICVRENSGNSLGTYGLGKRNERGDILLIHILAGFCHTKNMTIINTVFKHTKNKRYTWISSDGCSRD